MIDNDDNDRPKALWWR